MAVTQIEDAAVDVKIDEPFSVDIKDIGPLPFSDDKIDQIGYDLALPGGDAAERTREVVSYLSGSPAEPFFISVGFFESHRPFSGAAAGEHQDPPDAGYVSPPAIIPDTPQTR